MNTNTVVLLIHSCLLFVGIPGMVYYVENFAPYNKDKEVIELKFEHQQKQLDKLTDIVERLERK